MQCEQPEEIGYIYSIEPAKIIEHLYFYWDLFLEDNLMIEFGKLA